VPQIDEFVHDPKHPPLHRGMLCRRSWSPLVCFSGMISLLGFSTLNRYLPILSNHVPSVSTIELESIDVLMELLY
jgi:hypothetical protein